MEDLTQTCPEGWSVVLLKDGTSCLERPADDRDGFACIRDDETAWVYASCSEEARRIDAEACR